MTLAATPSRPRHAAPEPSPLVTAQEEAAYYLATSRDLQRQLDAAITLLCEHAGADRVHWQRAASARANEKKP